jgi:hypothetical protein
MGFRPRFVAIENAPSASLVAEKWRRSYFSQETGKWGVTVSGPAEETYRKLVGLGDAASVREISEIVHAGWTLCCDSCGAACDQAIRIGDIGNESKSYCSTCISEAYELASVIGGKRR